MLTSDPQLRAASRPDYAHFDAHAGVSAGAVPMANEPPAAATIVQEKRSGGFLARTIYLTLGLSAVALAIRVMTATLAAPLETVTTVPNGGVGISVRGAKPATAIIYSQGAGLHLVRVPAHNGAGAKSGLIPRHYSSGDVLVLSLGGSSLHVEGVGPDGPAKHSFRADAPIVTVNLSPSNFGVKIGW